MQNNLMDLFISTEKIESVDPSNGMLTTPLKHQADLMGKIKDLPYYGILWEMGLGKTWIGCYLIHQEICTGNEKILIIAPNSVVDVWEEQLLQHTNIPKAVICKLRGTAKQRIEALKQPFNIFIINYEGLRVVAPVIQKMQFNIIIADESQRIKNHKALQTKICCSLQSKKRFILSGTPLLNTYLDVFSQWLFLDHGKTFGGNFYAFRNGFFYDANATKYRGTFSEWKPKKGSEDRIKSLMATSCHRLEKKDCLDLPEKIYETKYCFLTPEQAVHYKALKQEAITFIQAEVCTANVALTKLIRLNQLTSGFLKTTDDNLIPLKTNPKLELLKETVDEILENPNNKIIIWAHFRYDIETIVKTFQNYNPVAIYGGVTNRAELVNSFQTSPQVRVFVGQPHSAGLGLTLTAANYAIYYSYNFSLEDRLQSEDRCHRKGSEIHNSITYIDLVCKDTIDEAILKSVKNKGDMAKDVMEYIKVVGNW